MNDLYVRGKLCLNRQSANSHRLSACNRKIYKEHQIDASCRSNYGSDSNGRLLSDEGRLSRRNLLTLTRAQGLINSISKKLQTVLRFTWRTLGVGLGDQCYLQCYAFRSQTVLAGWQRDRSCAKYAFIIHQPPKPSTGHPQGNPPARYRGSALGFPLLKRTTYNLQLKWLFAFSFMLLTTFHVRCVYARQQDSYPLRGRVVSAATGVALDGATVKLEGRQTSVLTDQRGYFTLRTADQEGTLVVSYIGYLAKHVKFSKTGNILLDIKLDADDNLLDEAVVIAYGTTTRRLNTGAIGKVSAEDISKQPVSNPLAALQGRVPGLVITQNNGMPGTNFNVQIRGRNSIDQGSEPLYIIDGIPFDGANRSQRAASLNVNNPFNTLNPADIESIEVLKDADATSIYGSRGANGVILITTKRATAGALNVHVNAYKGWGKVGHTAEWMNAEDFRSVRREALANDNREPTAGNAFDLLMLDSTLHNDWNNILIGNTAHSNNVQFDLSGGDQQLSYKFGGNYYRESTVFPGDFALKRKVVNLSLTHRAVNDRFQASFNVSYADNNSNLMPQDLTQYVNRIPFGFELLDDAGNLVWGTAEKQYGNPLSYLKQNYSSIADRLTATSSLSYTITDGLALKLTAGFNKTGLDEKLLTPIAAQNPDFDLKGSAGFGTSKGQNWNLEPQINYTLDLNDKLKMTALIGATWQENKNSGQTISGSGYSSDALLNSIKGASTVTVDDNASLYHYQAFFGRVSFNWKETLLLNLNARRDGSSRFASGKQFANFASVGAAWIFSQSAFVKNSLPFVSFGKLRGSYGTSGNDQIGDYRYLDSYNPLRYAYQGQLSLQPARLYNNNYGWEQFRKLDFGLELGFLKDRLYLTIDYYRNRSVNQLVSYSLPTQTGFTNVLRNFPGIVENKGTEVEVRSENIKRQNFSWTTSFNISVPRNKLVAFPGLESSSYASSYALGHPLNVLMGYRFLGVNPETGSYQVADTNGDGSISSADYLPVGTTDPKYLGGLQNTLSYKGLSLDFFFQFVKQLGQDPVYSNLEPLGSGNNMLAITKNHWKEPGDVTPYAKSTTQFNTLRTSYSWVRTSDAVLTDASFVRLKNVSLSYRLPIKAIGTWNIRQCSVYMQAQNLLTFTPFEGADPESQSLRVLPPLRMFTLGMQLDF